MIYPEKRTLLEFNSFDALQSAQITKLDEKAQRSAKRRLREQARPRGSLGRIEDLTVTLAGILGTTNLSIKPRVVQMFCGDHGIAEECVSVFPPETTFRVAKAAANNEAAINVFADQTDTVVQICNVGIRTDCSEIPAIKSRLVTPGTANISKRAAMTREQAISSILNGANFARQAVSDGFRAVVVGEVGNSNTTAASALFSALTGLSPEEVVGRGTGISDVVLIRKNNAVLNALEANKPVRSDPLDCLAKVGGLELGAMTGAFIGGAASGIPCIVDGFLSSVSALLATRIRPEVRPYLLFSHLSKERAHRILLEQMNAKPLLELNLCLGEGTGGLASLQLLDIACAILHGIKTFKECKIPSPYARKSVT